MIKQSCHWDWYWNIKKQHTPKVLCENYSSLDSFEFFRNKESINVCMDKVCLTMPPYKLKAILHADSLFIEFEYQDKFYGYKIPVEKNQCNYGGVRFYFRCPKCNKRMRILYCFQGFFACRKCLKLGYYSQRLRPTRRYRYMSQKVKDVIHDRGGELDFYKKPPHMHTTSYEKLLSKQFYYESKSNQAQNKELRIWYGPKIEPYLDEFFDYVDESKEWRKI